MYRAFKCTQVLLKLPICFSIRSWSTPNTPMIDMQFIWISYFATHPNNPISAFKMESDTSTTISIVVSIYVTRKVISLIVGSSPISLCIERTVISLWHPFLICFIYHLIINQARLRWLSDTSVSPFSHLASLGFFPHHLLVFCIHSEFCGCSHLHHSHSIKIWSKALTHSLRYLPSP